MASCQDQESRSDGVMGFVAPAEASGASGDGIRRRFYRGFCTEHVHVFAVKTTREYDDLDFSNRASGTLSSSFKIIQLLMVELAPISGLSDFKADTWVFCCC